MTRTRLLLYGTLLGAALAVGAILLRRSSPPRPLSAIPARSLAVLSVELGALRQRGLLTGALAPLVARLSLQKFLGACALDPWAVGTEAHVAVPVSDADGFVVAGTANVTRTDLERCGEALGISKASPTTSVGDMRVWGDPVKGRFAADADGLLLLGRGSFVEAALASRAGTEPSLLTSTPHATLRETLGKAPVVLTLVPPVALREKFRARWSPQDDGGALSATLAVLAVGLAAEINATTIHLRGEVLCDTLASCQTLGGLLERQRFQWSQSLTLRLAGLGPLIDSFKSEGRASAGGGSLLVTADLPTERLGSIVDLLDR